MTRGQVDRLDRLQQLLGQQKSLRLREAAELLGVSEMTIRRDLADHADRFTYLGGHILEAEVERLPYGLAEAARKNEVAKRAACAQCMPLLRGGETIFVDCGTTLVHLVDAVPPGLKLTVVCYALNVAERVVRNTSLSLILLGGKYQSASASFAALPGESSFQHLAINACFLSAAGLDDALGASCVGFHEAAWKIAAMKKSSRNYLVIDRSKLGQVHPAVFAQRDDFTTVITETGTYR
ncbi:DeoR/GlpR family DNA-binding transcription regulator [Qingshengfaniella alkalisoli]|uniref:DeoR/GlpR transcriptional regulator n=1 Tax=Qingshengfaniella alkalisoli TaxID=2599296 RepID=A0A5B8IBD1_9RHOB|nr:DeoR/GlpR family DNA-binding transcription regulator [Qingshengfaniella alkalisoli]QDY71499.1 DeoR/GlpR transcriptional regulator [Qingshengfaniella alkalisoli]